MTNAYEARSASANDRSKPSDGFSPRPRPGAPHAGAARQNRFAANTKPNAASSSQAGQIARKRPITAQNSSSASGFPQTAPPTKKAAANAGASSARSNPGGVGNVSGRSANASMQQRKVMSGNQQQRNGGGGFGFGSSKSRMPGGSGPGNSSNRANSQQHAGNSSAANRIKSPRSPAERTARAGRVDVGSKPLPGATAEGGRPTTPNARNRSASTRDAARPQTPSVVQMLGGTAVPRTPSQAHLLGPHATLGGGTTAGSVDRKGSSSTRAALRQTSATRPARRPPGATQQDMRQPTLLETINRATQSVSTSSKAHEPFANTASQGPAAPPSKNRPADNTKCCPATNSWFQRVSLVEFVLELGHACTKGATAHCPKGADT